MSIHYISNTMFSLGTKINEFHTFKELTTSWGRKNLKIVVISIIEIHKRERPNRRKWKTLERK